MAERKESLRGPAQFSLYLDHGISLHLGSVAGLFLGEARRAFHNQCEWKRGDVTGGPKSGQLLKCLMSRPAGILFYTVKPQDGEGKQVKEILQKPRS